MSQVYCFNSTDPDDYGHLRVNLPVMSGSKKVRFTVSSMCSFCYIRVLNTGDYITFKVEGDEKDYTVYVPDDYNTVPASTFITVMNSAMEKDNKIIVDVDKCDRIIFKSRKEFKIVGMSYNMSLVSGFHYVNELPLNSVLDNGYYVIKAKAVGYSLSTPVLYLTCNLGDTCFRHYSNDGEHIQASSVALMIYNTLTSEMPIVSSNADFSKLVPIMDISSITFDLVDANFKKVELLCPMYLTCNITDETQQSEVPDEEFYQWNYMRQMYIAQGMRKAQEMKEKNMKNFIEK